MRLPACGGLGGTGFVVVEVVDADGLGVGFSTGAMRFPLTGEIGVLAVAVGMTDADAVGSGRGGGAERLPTGCSVAGGWGGARFPAGCFSHAATA
jgi:hypothetical protein